MAKEMIDDYSMAVSQVNLHGVGYERIDADTKPERLMMGFDTHEHFIHFHRAGDRCVRRIHVRHAVAPEFIAGFEPDEAMRIGIEWERWRSRAGEEAA